MNSTVSPTDTKESNEVYIAGIFDLNSYDWGADIFNFTIKLINEGRWWDVDDKDAQVVYKLINSRCDETTAVRAYGQLRTENGGIPMDGIVGARCSGASASLARISGLDGVPQVSPSANSAQLNAKLLGTNDTEEFPYFSRLVAPNDDRGETGALVAMLRYFKWDRVTILATDRQFSKDSATAFRKLWAGDHNDASGKWTGEISYSDTIRLKTDGTVDESSVRQALSGVPVDDPITNSQIILVLAHNQHAYPILKIAALSEFQPDTIWIGPSAWVGRPATGDDVDFSWLPSYPGYIGPSLYRNRNEQYDTFFNGLQNWQNETGREVWTELPVFAAEMADSIVALGMAIKSLPLDQRRNGTAVTSQLRSLSFEGVSGQVEFTKDGNRKYPIYSILNAKENGGSTGVEDAVIANKNGNVGWQDIGDVSTSVGTASIDSKSICWANLGCSREEIPSDKYAVLRTKLPGWAVAIIVIFVLLSLLVAIKYWRSRRSKLKIKDELKAFRDSVVGMRAAKTNYIPTLTSSVGVERPQFNGTLIVQPADNIQWCWQETSRCMDQHTPDLIIGNPADCWVKYNEDSHTNLEAAFQEQGGKGKFEPMAGYVVDFGTMVQTKTATGFQRSVQRLVEQQNEKDSAAKEIDISEIQMGDVLPSEISEEPQMVMVKGDIVQISKQRPDGWAYGTKVRLLLADVDPQWCLLSEKTNLSFSSSMSMKQ
jgi:ABC-type branched-subunit amino acid transport system substrate-binding protein